MRQRIYVAGPYSRGDIHDNLRQAVAAADALADLGFAPYVPHLNHLWCLLAPRPYEFWIALDNEFLSCCQGLLRLRGESPGADQEVLLAHKLGIPVFQDITALATFFDV